MATHYRHTQFGTMTVLVLGVMALAFAAIAVEAGSHPRLLLVLVPAIGLSLALMVLFGSLTVEIRDKQIECRFGPGWIRRRIPLADVRDARAVRNRWWYGWGIRYTPQGWLFNVSGLDAVEIRLADGRRFRVGTDRPLELEAAIREAIGSPVPGRSRT